MQHGLRRLVSPTIPPLKSLFSDPIPSPPAPPPPSECTPKPSIKLQLRILLQPFHQHSLDPSSYAPIFQFLTRHNFIKLGHQAHAQVVLNGLQLDAFIAAKMVAMYASSGDLDSAVIIFDSIDNPSTWLYNSIIRAYTRHGFPDKALEAYAKMHFLGLLGDNFTLPFVLKSCADLSRVGMGRCVHGQALRFGLEGDFYVGASLIDMYVKCSGIGDARKMFDKMVVRDVASWNSLIAGYMKEGDISVAEDLFERMENRNVISWTAMISGYTQNGFADRALDLFDEMLQEGSEVKPNWVTIVSVLPACSHSADLERGRRIRDFAYGIGLSSNSYVLTALVGMYAKCGSLIEARDCFDMIAQNKTNLVAWNTMITAYASHGFGEEAVSIFEDMLRAGAQPDAVTFMGLLSGCSHSGLIDAGLKYFNDMVSIYSVEPRVEHYACVVDLLGRAGRLVEAKDLISKMPMQAGPSVWGALLFACFTHRNLGIAELAARRLFVLEPDNSGNYVLLSNMYAEAGMWEEVENLRVLLKCQGVKKSPGSSWTEIKGADTSSPAS